MSGIKIAKKTRDRLASELRKYQKIVGGLRERDVSEADTVTVIKDMMSDLFGYDKYTELTSEQQIRGTFCDLAVQLNGKVHYLAEVKAAGVNLNNNHLRQAVNYGANEGIEWIILTNAIEWRVYRIKFGKPIDYEEIFAFDVCSLSGRSEDDLMKLALLCRENVATDALGAFHQKAQIVNRHIVTELIKGPEVLATIRKEMRRLFEVKVTDEEILRIFETGIQKRDLTEGPQQSEANAAVKKAIKAIERKRAKIAASTA